MSEKIKANNQKETNAKAEEPAEQPMEEMLADLEAIDKKKHPNKQKKNTTLPIDVTLNQDGTIANVELPEIKNNEQMSKYIKEVAEKCETQGHDFISKAEVLAKVEPALIRVRRNGVTMATREVLALVNGIIADIKSL